MEAIDARAPLIMDWEAFYQRFREPDFIPGYEIQNRLGGGAFGEVYKARKHSIGKSYAIKFLKVDDDAQRDAVGRELEQVRHFAALDHPNLVSIEDLGTAQGVPYLIMGYAGEDTLARRLKQGRLDEESALSFFVQTCRGVLALHDRRLVHFDLKPSNVFLKGDIARVGDYGLSKMMVDGKTTLSFGRGTPQYMAPEMLRNRADHRADIYSLGVILFECASGKLPFEPEVAGAIAVREDDRPPVFPADFPPRLRPIVERCLRLAPVDRYASVADVLTGLGQTARSGDSLRLVPPSQSSVPAKTPLPGSAAPSAAPATPPGEVRQTAAELTRGAVEVARGVWDGLRSAPRTDPRATPRGETPTPRPAESNLGANNSSATDARPTPSTTPVRASPPIVRSLAAPDSDVITLHTLSDSGPISATPGVPSRADADTIPVPPAVRGGWIGTLGATLALGLEVLLTLARGVGYAALGLVARRGRVAGVAGTRVLGGAVRLVLFVLLLALLGGLSTLLAFELLSSKPS